MVGAGYQPGGSLPLGPASGGGGAGEIPVANGFRCAFSPGADSAPSGSPDSDNNIDISDYRVICLRKVPF